MIWGLDLGLADLKSLDTWHSMTRWLWTSELWPSGLSDFKLTSGLSNSNLWPHIVILLTPSSQSRMELVHSFYEALSQVQLKLFFVRFPFISWQILPLEHLGRRKVGGWSAPEQWVRVDRARLARPLRVREGVVVTLLNIHKNIWVHLTKIIKDKSLIYLAWKWSEKIKLSSNF